MADKMQAAVAEDAAPAAGPWLVAFLLLSVGAISMAFSVIAPLLGPIAARFGGEAVAQKIVVGPLLGFAIGGIVAGWIVAALGARLTILISAGVFALAGASGLYAQSAAVLLVGAFLLGMAAVVLATAGAVVLVERFQGDARARMIGYQAAAGSLLNAGGVFLSGLIAETAGWRASFLLFVVLGAVTLAVAALGVRTAARPPAEAGGRGLAAFAPVVPIYVVVALYLLTMTNTVTHMSLLLAAAGSTSTTVAAAIIAVQGLAAMVAAFFYGRLASGVGRLPTVALGVVLAAGGLIITGAAPGAPAFAAGCFGMGASVGLILPFLTEELMRLAPASVRPQALGFFSTAQFAGGFLNPFVMGPVRAALGLHGMYIAVGVVLGLLGFAALGVLAARRRAGPA
jgi:MFS family permease